MYFQIKYFKIITILSLLSSCTVIYNFPDLSDYKIFPYRIVRNSPEYIFFFSEADTLNNLGKTISISYNKFLPNVITLDEYVEISKTAAFILIRNDTVIFKKYNNNYRENSMFNTFSITKLFITTLVGIAIDEGKIRDVDEPITNYIPELLERDGFSEITIRHLLNHTSGIKFSDAIINPFSDNARYYYCRNLRKQVFKAELFESPGIETNYNSINTQLLVMILERATGTNVSLFLQNKIWQKIGMEYEAKWSLDNKGKNSIEKGFSCLNCTAIDLAKIGRLYLNNGLWNDQQIISQRYISEAIKRDTTYGSTWDFHFNIKLGPKEYNSYYARGLYGQLLYIYPKKNIIIVCLAEKDLKYNPAFLNQIVMQIIDQI